jgi:hypothetical protein
VRRNEHKKTITGGVEKSYQKKPKSPDLIGTMRLQRHTIQAILKDVADPEFEDVVCNLAGWRNDDHQGPYLTVEISPKYVSREASPARPLDFIFNDQEESI